MVSGRIFDIQRFSIHDGPGIRTTVFFKGCPLRCLWCGNPESIPSGTSLSYVPARCIECGVCVDACPEKAILLPVGEKVRLDRHRCTACGDCARQCDSKALEAVGRDATVQDVMTTVLRDSEYYKASGGGMTLSGGDPLFQPRFAEAVLRAAKARHVHCCVETSGYALWGAIRPLVPLVDLWLFDFKETDPRLHERFTGKSNRLILDTLRRLHDAGARIALRCPMIPQHNARQEHLDGIVALVRRLPRIKSVELLPYYDLWRGKLKRFGLTSAFPESVKPPEHATMQAWNDYLRKQGVSVIG